MALFSRTSAFADLAAARAVELPEEEFLREEPPEGDMRRVASNDLEDWYRQLDAMATEPFHGPIRDELEELRDSVYRYLR